MPRLAACLLAASVLAACSKAPPMPGGLPAALEQPVPFAPGLVPAPAGALAVHPDGDLAVVVLRGNEGAALLAETRAFAGGWSAPVPLPFARPGDEGPAFTPDGEALLFRRADASDTILRAPYTSGLWSVPRALPLDAVSSRATASRDGTLALASRRFRSEGGLDVWLLPAGREGWRAPVNLRGVNTAQDDTDPFLDADGRVLLLASDRPGGFGGLDLYVSYREAGAWTTPRNLGPLVNTAADERLPWLSAGGGQLFFSRERYDAAGRGAAVWVVGTEALLQPVP